MSKPSYDVLESLQQQQNQKSTPGSSETSVPPPILTRSSRVILPIITSAQTALLPHLSEDYLADLAAAEAESIYNEDITTLAASDDDTAVIPRTPSASPLAPSSITKEFEQLDLSAVQTISSAGKQLERTTRSLDFSAQVRALSTTVAPTLELAPLAHSAPPTITTTSLQKKPAKLEPIKKIPETEPIESSTQFAPAGFPEPKPQIIIPPLSSIVPRPALSDDLTVIPSYYASLPRSVRSGCFTAWGSRADRAATTLARATPQSRIVLSPIVRQEATPPATLSELLLEPQQLPGQMPQVQSQPTFHLPATIRKRF